MDYFATLGARVDALWRGVNRDDEALPDVAERALAEMPPVEHVDPTALARALLSPTQQATRQLAPVGVFGQPGVTVYFGHEFVIDVYWWVHALAAIHNHPFCGVFTVLRGHSLHSVYEFEPHESLGPRATIGEVRLRSIEWLRPGDVRLFSLRRRPLIHTLLHVPIPSVSMVIRTIRTIDYVRYLPPSIALAMSDPDDGVHRQLRLLETLRTSRDPDYRDGLRSYLAHADFETAFRVVSAAWSDALERGESEALLDTARARHGARMDTVREVLQRARRTQRIDGLRAQMTSDDDRFVVSLLLTAETRAQVIDTMHTRYGRDDDALARLSSWVDASGIFAADDDAPRFVSKALIAGARIEEIPERMRGTFSPESIDTRRDDIETFCRGALFAPMAR